MPALERLATALENLSHDPIIVSGVVEQAVANERWIAGLSEHAALGDQIVIDHREGVAVGSVVRVDIDHVVATLAEHRSGGFLGARAHLEGPFRLHPHKSWLGRVVDALGRPLDGQDPPKRGNPRAVDSPPPAALLRQPLTIGVSTGVKAVDIFAPLVEGQRVGIFAGSGVGKSTLLGMVAAAADFDVVVASLVGERGREVNEFLAGPLSAHRDKTVTVVATGDETALMRSLAPMTAMTVAEHFRDEGKRVLLILDSLTRFAHAARDVALAAGEPPVARGYPPSVFSQLTRLVERAGRSDGKGCITALLAVLVDGDDLDEPVADAARGSLDGHIVLSRAIAEAGRFPAVDPLASLSRLAERAFRPDEWELSRRLRALISLYEDTRDLRLLGGYRPGSDGELDRAVEIVPTIYEALRQTPVDPPSGDAFAELASLLVAQKDAGEQGSSSA